MKVGVAVASVVAIACGSRHPESTTAAPVVQTTAERMIALLPEGAQLVVEIDVARLRNNAVVGDVVKRALRELSAARIPGLVTGPSLAGALPPEQGCATPSECGVGTADVIVFAAYDVGTSGASTVALLATAHEIAGGVRVAPDLVALGPEQWTGQVATRAAIAATQPLWVPASVRDLRARSVPKGATGAAVRVVAVLSFDARVAFARLTGLEAPAQLSLWADVADDAAVVLDLDTTDPGTRRTRDSVRRFVIALREAFAATAKAPGIRALGVTSSLAAARFATAGPWVRAVITIGPRHLTRVVERARAMLVLPP